ncbi:MinD/ParA family ATP-binding protein [Williamsia maris]|nr:AAA family ATPase [Williamsia maris]
MDHETAPDGAGTPEFDSIERETSTPPHTAPPSWLPDGPPQRAEGLDDATRWIPTVGSDAPPPTPPFDRPGPADPPPYSSSPQYDQPSYPQNPQYGQPPFPPQFEQHRPPFDPGPGQHEPQFAPGPPPGQGAPWHNGPQGQNGQQGPGPEAPQHQPPINPASDPFGRPPGSSAPAENRPGRSSIDEVALLRKARRAPGSGWRRAVHRISAGAINPGDSPDDLYYQQLVERVNRPVRGDYRIAVLSLKGGVGKTTTTVGLGSIYSSLRGDRVIAVDANPDLGTLAQRIPQQTRSTVRDLLADTSIYRYSDVRAHTSQSPSRLEVLASERDPAVAEAFSEQDYRGVMRVLQRFYNIILTDCGTGLSHSAMNGVLDLANALILVSSPAIDGARSAGATLDWLQAHGYGHLVSRAVVVLSSSRSGASTIDTKQLSQHFLTRCRAVQMIPFDDHLAEGAEMDLELLGKGTHRALVELAATVADDFSSTNLRRTDPFYQ